VYCFTTSSPPLFANIVTPCGQIVPQKYVWGHDVPD
jgi:hypothetical protein